MSRHFFGYNYEFDLKPSHPFPLVHTLLKEIRQMHHKAYKGQREHEQKITMQQVKL